MKPDYSPAWFNKGNIEYAQKDYNAALISYNKTIEYDPKNSSAIYDRGIAKLMLKDKDWRLRRLCKSFRAWLCSSHRCGKGLLRREVKVSNSEFSN